MSGRLQVAVCGPAHCGEAERAGAYRVGELLAHRGATLVCGGGGGVMAAAAAGAASHQGLVVGVRPDADRNGASADLSAVLTTNLGQARNAVIIWSVDAVIVVGGSWGTLSEVALAMWRGDVPVVQLRGWRVLDAYGEAVPGPIVVESPEEAVDVALGRVHR